MMRRQWEKWNMFEKVLIANRGEIACRVIKTCRRLGIATVAVFSEADAESRHVELADEAHCIGSAHVRESYLSIDKIVDVATRTGADAVHPGYGLLSENPEFVERLTEAGIAFVGPRASSMRLMGDKAAARAFAEKCGVPVVPGSDGPVMDEDAAVALAEKLGYPMLVKAAGGGGGIGMKVATKEKRLRKAFQECQRRGESSFGNPAVYVERFIENPRHIEIQVIADIHGCALHLFERECTIQRRHQKVLEEAPSVIMDRIPELRERMTTAALSLVRASEYHNAGTVEFIVDQEGEFYFIEMNTRLQVEHPVTEMITGLDLVELQLRIAAGEPLELDASAVSVNGHAIECRIYAEDPSKSFLPAPGRIGEYNEPSGEGVRVDSGVQAETEVTPYYDPMIAKVVVHGCDREEAIDRARGALADFSIEGLTTNLEMHRALLTEPAFHAGEFHTGWLQDWVKTAL
jgi:acetyl-CoA carboxylase, biotin carboxylase subunit